MDSQIFLYPPKVRGIQIFINFIQCDITLSLDISVHYLLILQLYDCEWYYLLACIVCFGFVVFLSRLVQ